MGCPAVFLISPTSCTRSARSFSRRIISESTASIFLRTSSRLIGLSLGWCSFLLRRRSGGRFLDGRVVGGVVGHGRLDGRIHAFDNGLLLFGSIFGLGKIHPAKFIHIRQLIRISQAEVLEEVLRRF